MYVDMMTLSTLVKRSHQALIAELLTRPVEWNGTYCSKKQFIILGNMLMHFPAVTHLYSCKFFYVT